MDIKTYLESRGWESANPDDTLGDIDMWCKDDFYCFEVFDGDTKIPDMIHIFLDGDIFHGKLLTGEKADIVMEALGIT